jgi:hypothetical protein
MQDSNFLVYMYTYFSFYWIEQNLNHPGFFEFIVAFSKEKNSFIDFTSTFFYYAQYKNISFDNLETN